MITAFSEGNIQEKAIKNIAILYVTGAILYLWNVIPLTFRADYLAHVMDIVEWDSKHDYSRFFSFVFEFQSGHIIALQKVIALANFYLFHHSALFSKVTGLGIMLLCWAFYTMLAVKISGKNFQSSFFSLIVAILIFSVQGYEVISWTDSIPAHYPTACFATVSLYFLGKYWNSKRKGFLWQMALWAGAAILTNGSGWAILPAFFMLFFLHGLTRYFETVSQKDKQQTVKVLLILLFAATILLSAVGYWVLKHANAGHTGTGLVQFDRLLNDPMALFIYLMAIIASPISQLSISLVWPYGLVVSILAVIAIQKLLRVPNNQFPIWGGLILFGFFSCLMVSVGRYEREVYGYGIVSSRYSIYALPIYIGITATYVLLKYERLQSVVQAYLIKAFFVFSAVVFIYSSLQLHVKMIEQTREVAESTRMAPYWNQMAMARLSSAKQFLPRLYLQTLPELAKQGKAEIFTKEFIPAGVWGDKIKHIRDRIEQGDVIAVNHTSRCSASDGNLITVLDNRMFYNIRPIFGTDFVRFTGYIRNADNCDAPMEYLIALTRDSEIMCVSKSGAYLWADLPNNAKQPEDLMRSQYAFDFSCPILSNAKNVFPVKMVGYSPSSNSIYFLQ